MARHTFFSSYNERKIIVGFFGLAWRPRPASKTTTLYLLKDILCKLSFILRLKVVAGAHDISVEADETWQISSIEDVIIHANFNIPSPYFNDLSLIKLSTPLHFNDFVGPIKLAEFKYDPPGEGPLQQSTKYGMTKKVNVLLFQRVHRASTLDGARRQMYFSAGCQRF